MSQFFMQNWHAHDTNAPLDHYSGNHLSHTLKDMRVLVAIQV